MANTPPSIQDMLRMWLSANLPFNNVIGQTTDVQAGSQVPNAYSQDSKVASGSVTAPGAGATIVNSPNNSGIVRCNVWLTFTGSGTPVLADCTNWQITYGGVTFKAFADITPGKVTGPFEFYSTGFNPLNVSAIAAGTANVTYNATAITTRIA